MPDNNNPPRPLSVIGIDRNAEYRQDAVAALKDMLVIAEDKEGKGGFTSVMIVGEMEGSNTLLLRLSDAPDKVSLLGKLLLLQDEILGKMR